MKQIFAIVLLALMLALMLAGCDGDAGNYAAKLRARAEGGAPPSSFNNGQPGEQTPTALRPAPTMLPLSDNAQQSAPPPAVERVQALAEEAWRDNSKDPNVSDALASIIAFIGSTPAVLIGATVVAAIAMRKKVRK